MLQDVLRFVHTTGDQAVCLFDPGIEITIFSQLWALLMHPAWYEENDKRRVATLLLL